MNLGPNAQTFESLLANKNEICKYACQKQMNKLDFKLCEYLKLLKKRKNIKNNIYNVVLDP
jgi:hypothetical protein